MIKLARNICAEKELVSEKGLISWDFKKKLDELQKLEQLRFANSLSSNHAYHKNKIINVRLVVQSLSSRVADALAY